jgi:hypothetical protein
MQGKLTHPRFIVAAASSALALVFSGCFQNMSGGESVYAKKKSSQSGFTDTTPSSGGNFDGSVLKANAQIVGTYAGVNASSVYDGSYGLVINLEKSFTTALGAATLQDLLARSGEAGVASMPVELSINSFKVKAKFPFGKVAVDKTLRNVMVIRPNFSNVDFATGYIPDTAPIVQTSSRYLYTYGGVEDGDAAIARMTMFFRNTSPYGTGFLPTVGTPDWGQRFPSESDAAANAEFMRLTPDLGKILYNICIDPNTNMFGNGCDPTFQTVATSPQDFLLAIHPLKITQAAYDALNPIALRNEYTRYPVGHPDYPNYYKVGKAWVIYPMTERPAGLLLCSSAFDSSGSNGLYTIQNAAGATVTYEVADKRACDCGNNSLENLYASAENGAIIPTADRTKLFDYCVSNATTTSSSPLGTSSKRGVENKVKYLRAAISGKPKPPVTGIALPPTGVLNDVTFVSIQ